MKAHQIIPRRDSEFSLYFYRVVNYLYGTDTPGTEPEVLPDNTQRLGITRERLSPVWPAFNRWDDIFPKSQNPDVRTKAITAEKTALRGEIERMLRELYNDIPKSKLRPDDRETLNLPERNASSPRPAISTQPFAEMQSSAGGRIKITLRVQNDASRPSIHPDAHSIEMAYSIAAQPVSPDSAQKVIVFKKALNNVPFNIADAGKKVFAYFRWKNESDESKNGPWTNLRQAVIA